MNVAATNSVMNASADANAQFAAWVGEHRGIVVRIARSFAESPDDIADLQQEMQLQLWLSLKSFSGQAKPSTWIYKVCMNTALAWRRRSIRRENHIESGIDPSELVTVAASPADTLAEREVLAKLYAGIRVMPEIDRAILLLMLDGVAYREIAEITGLSESNVGVKLTRARKQLAEYMKGVANELG